MNGAKSFNLLILLAAIPALAIVFNLALMSLLMTMLDEFHSGEGVVLAVAAWAGLVFVGISTVLNWIRSQTKHHFQGGNHGSEFAIGG